MPDRLQLDRETGEKLREALSGCRDLAFAHLAEVEVPGHEPTLVLFAWMEAPALRSVRRALDPVCRTVAGVLPEDRFLDVVLLNPAPDLLRAVESAGCLFVEPDPEERSQALRALEAGDPGEVPPSDRPWWWPF